MLQAILIVSATVVIVAFMASVAYGGPKLYWYVSQTRLLKRSQAGEQKLLDMHIADHKPIEPPGGFTEITGEVGPYL